MRMPCGTTPHPQQALCTDAPLAARLRPHTLDDFIGQDAIVGPGRLLRRAIQADQLSSLIFYGPPGTGKTTLAQIIANTTQAHFVAINAVLAGIRDIRAAVETAQQRWQDGHQRTILFVDEVHRFNKAQQDALLPWVENGTLILIGATTENPYFEVNKALVSRSRLFQLKSLTAEDLRQVAHRALTDPTDGYGQRSLHIEPAALTHLINIANGDARALLNALELAVETTAPDATGEIQIGLAIAEASIQRRAVLYDKEGDAHFDTISAFIKSLRGSDPDAALYWLARMVYAGEDPRFIFRRMLILASEDVGLADPQAVGVVNACAQAFDRIGLPEGQYPLAQAALYLATTAKSNTTLGYFDALKAVEQDPATVPNHLKDGNRDRQALGHGKGYHYPHAYRDHWVAQQYLPSSLQGQVFYHPSDQGWEAQVAPRIRRQREAQLAALAEQPAQSSAENVSYGQSSPTQDRWLQRTMGQAGQQAAQVRDHLFHLTHLQRHHVVLDLQAKTGLLTWEALRRVPEGSVYACVTSERDAKVLEEQASTLPELQRPILVTTALPELSTALDQQAPDQRFDWIVGRNALASVRDKGAIAPQLAALLQPSGHVALAETVPSHSQRLYRLVAPDEHETPVKSQWVAAEEAIYTDTTGDPLLNWDPNTLAADFTRAGFTVSVSLEHNSFELYVTAQLLERWFGASSARQSYGDRLLAHLSEVEVEGVRSQLTQKLLHKTVEWHTTIAYLTAHLTAHQKDNN